MRLWQKKYTNKESTFHNIAIFHTGNHPYISNSDMLGGTISATYVGMVV